MSYRARVLFGEYMSDILEILAETTYTNEEYNEISKNPHIPEELTHRMCRQYHI